MKKYLNPLALVLSLTGAAVAFNACTCNQQSGSTSKKEIEKEVKEFVYPLPTAYEVTEMLNRIEAPYILGLSNPIANAGKYITEKSQALNLGVYSADLSYASAYRQKQETMDYMAASKKLIEELNISAAIDPDIVDKIEQSADDKDALVKLITESFYGTYAFLQKNERAGISSLIMAGSWVEALYISTNISEDTFKNKEMVQIVMDQKDTLAKLLEIMAKDAQNSNVTDMVNDLQSVKNAFDTINGGISEEQYSTIVKEVRILRDKIVA
ncbi:MAG: hypothetical protein QM786_18065 [Breznakibacter sp.]